MALVLLQLIKDSLRCAARIPDNKWLRTVSGVRFAVSDKSEVLQFPGGSEPAWATENAIGAYQLRSRP